jgi:Leucine-rich repeat (LRR) protein
MRDAWADQAGHFPLDIWTPGYFRATLLRTMATDAGGIAPVGGAPPLNSSQQNGLLALTTSFGTAQLTAITAFLAAVAAALAKLQDLAKALHITPGMCALMLTGLLLLLFFSHTLPSVLEQRKKAKLGSIQGATRAGYFQLTVRKDEEAFQRADGKHEEVLRWLRGSPSRVLYLTGSSGAGKSSLLEAWVLPKLQRDGVTIIRLRGYQDPAEGLEDELKRPGVIWKTNAPETHDLDDLFEQAMEQVRPSRILVVFDQFEEFLILQEQALGKRFVEFLKAQKGVKDTSSGILLVFRSEYDGFIQELDLPPPIYGQNFQKVSAFTLRASQEFFAGSELKIDTELLADVLGEAARVEETPGMIRPVTLNLCGLVLERFSMGLPYSYRPGHLIRGFVHEAIFDREVPEATPVLLKKLISHDRTKRPCTIDELAEGTTFSPRQAQGAMFKLADPERGIVHALDSDCRVWEISHDFLVPIIDSILAGWTTSTWSKIRPWLPLGYLVIFILLLYVAPRLFPNPVNELMKLQWRARELNEKRPEDQPLLRLGIRYEFSYTTTNGSMPPPESLRVLRRVNGKFIVRFAGLKKFDDTTFAEWRNLNQLWGLYLGGNRFQDTSGLRNLPPSLVQLGLADTGVVSDAELAILPRTLNWLNLERVRGITDAGLKDLPPNLTSLDLFKVEITDAEVKDLPRSLTWLKLIAVAKVTDAGLKYLPPKLTTLYLGGNPGIDNAGLESLPPGLTELHIDHDPGITDAGLKNLPASLTLLEVTGDPQITDTALQKLPATIHVERGD